MMFLLLSLVMLLLFGWSSIYLGGPDKCGGGAGPNTLATLIIRFMERFRPMNWLRPA
jgi:hypothetical protein